jgi:acetolactate synthase I/II/III large subunit
VTTPSPDPVTPVEDSHRASASNGAPAPEAFSSQFSTAATTPDGEQAFTGADSLVEALYGLGVRAAYGVSGGGIAATWAALLRSDIQTLHFRHETAAAFAATERHFVTGEPVVVFTTTGPGITNALTGLMAARGEGAKVILISPTTAGPQRGRGAIQETGAKTLGASGLLSEGALFDYATIVESCDELPQVFRRLAQGLGQPGRFVAHLSVPTNIQGGAADPYPTEPVTNSLPAPAPDVLERCVEMLMSGPFFVWIGFGARAAAPEVRELIERTGAVAVSSPRGKGILPEDHPQFFGVTGLGGHPAAKERLQELRPKHALVLGTRLAEGTSGWDQSLVPTGGFIHVDVDPTAPGAAYPDAPTLPVISDTGQFLRALLTQLRDLERWTPRVACPPDERCPAIAESTTGPVHPERLMRGVQRHLVDEGAAIITEAGCSLTWATHYLRFSTPAQFRPSTGWASMGHGVGGVLGIAHATGRKAAAITGDASMLMGNELNTAANYGIPAIWIVLNDGRFNMVHQGMSAQGLMRGMTGAETRFPSCDFVAIARAMGADGIRVETEDELDDALMAAMASPDPFVVDVVIDAEAQTPMASRCATLMLQGLIGEDFGEAQ